MSKEKQARIHADCSGLLVLGFTLVSRLSCLDWSRAAKGIAELASTANKAAQIARLCAGLL